MAFPFVKTYLSSMKINLMDSIARTVIKIKRIFLLKYYSILQVIQIAPGSDITDWKLFAMAVVSFVESIRIKYQHNTKIPNSSILIEIKRIYLEIFVRSIRYTNGFGNDIINRRLFSTIPSKPSRHRVIVVKKLRTPNSKNTNDRDRKNFTYDEPNKLFVRSNIN